MRYLLDTCVLSELVKSEPDDNVTGWLKARKANELCTSAMTWGELHRGVAKLPNSKRRSELTIWLERLEMTFEGRILAFDHKVAEVWAQMVVQTEAKGKPMAAFDSIIAATARTFNCQLVTRNVRDFAHADVALLDPWQIH